MNAIFQEYKRQVDECKSFFKKDDECEVVLVDEIETPYEIKPTEISIEDKKKGEYNRAKEKQEVRKMSEEYIDR